ncbi:HEAT repeat domain-containing protein, partial [Barnesiella intestinihominis]|uniref:HEAT repeat domain-containing protein n=1 Tax=Barnesiella intestinihominis TaxID=487174 RepID=UPI003FD899E8
VLAKLAKDSDCDVRRNAAGNPNTPAEVLAKLAKDSYWAVRSNAAGNPNTPVDVLTELAKDSEWYVRYYAARNPNTPGYEAEELQFIIKDTYVSVQGTTHIWYKHNYPNVAPFYTCGCFCGSREQLLMRIYITDNQGKVAERMRILNALDEKFKEVFNR